MLALQGFTDKEKVVSQSLSWRSPWWKIPQFKRRVQFQLAEVDFQHITDINGFLLLRVHETVIKAPWSHQEMLAARELYSKTELATHPVAETSLAEKDGKAQI